MGKWYAINEIAKAKAKAFWGIRFFNTILSLVSPTYIVDGVLLFFFISLHPSTAKKQKQHKGKTNESECKI